MLVVHSWLRWLVIVAGAAATVERLREWRHGSEPRVSRLHRVFVGVLDAQLLLGLLLLIVVSPLPRAGVADLGATMNDSVLRFFTIEHAFGMLVAIAAAHVAIARLRAGRPHAVRHAAALQIVWLLVTLVAVPWPAMPYGRPLFRLG